MLTSNSAFLSGYCARSEGPLLTTFWRLVSSPESIVARVTKFKLQFTLQISRECKARSFGVKLMNAIAKESRDTVEHCRGQPGRARPHVMLWRSFHGMILHVGCESRRTCKRKWSSGSEDLAAQRQMDLQLEGKDAITCTSHLYVSDLKIDQLHQMSGAECFESTGCCELAHWVYK